MTENIHELMENENKYSFTVGIFFSVYILDKQAIDSFYEMVRPFELRK